MWTMFMLVLSLNFPSAMNRPRVTSVYHQTVSWLQLAVQVVIRWTVSTHVSLWNCRISAENVAYHRHCEY